MNVKAPLFKDEKLQSLFDKNGFVKVRLLDEMQADELTALFNDTKAAHSTTGNLHHTTTDTQNPELIRQVDAKIKTVFGEGLDKMLNDYKPLVGCIHIKEWGEGSETGIHQDPTFVDEEQYYSANVWVALQDTDEKNGNLFFIKGSHKVQALRVTPNTPRYYESFYDALPGMAVQMPLKNGEAVIFHNSTIHGATPNLTDKLRLAATLLVTSAPADWYLYYQDQIATGGKIEQYQLDLDKFIAIPKDGRPDKKAFKQNITATFPQLSKEDFIARTDSTDKGYLRLFKNFFRMKSAV